MINKVMYIQYQGNKRTTTIASNNGYAVIHDTCKAIVQEVQVIETIDDQAYMDYLTQRMLCKIHANHIKTRKGNK